MIVCDTSTLSHFFRRPDPASFAAASEVEALIRANRAALLGVVRQELLSGIKSSEQFNRVEAGTRALPLFLAEEKDHVMAAQFYNLCRSKGVQGSAIDFLICAMSIRRNFAIYSTDPDFLNYEPIIPIHLHWPKKS